MEMETQDDTALWPKPSGYAETHCRQCVMGWSRTGTQGGVLTICLLDRERVLANMADCDRYELKSKVV